MAEETDDNSGHDEELDAELLAGAGLHLPGFLKRNAWLFTGLVVVFALGPSITQLLESYRAVVLEVGPEHMLIVRGDRPPEWVASLQVEHGTVLLKEAGSWDPRAVPEDKSDTERLKTYRRYTSSYEGRIKAIRPPAYPLGPSVAILTLQDGKTTEIELWAQHLAGAAVGKTLRKEPGTWDPVLSEPSPEQTEFKVSPAK